MNYFGNVLRKVATIFLILFVFIKISGQCAYLPPDKPCLVIGIVV